MRAVVQRVATASVTVRDECVGKIGEGILVFLGIKHGDDERTCEKLALKCAHLRIFEDERGKMNVSLLDRNGEVLVVSQFTLYADTEKGLRPSFTAAEEPRRAQGLYERFIQVLKNRGIRVEAGIFGARMEVKLENSGPVTIILEE